MEKWDEAGPAWSPHSLWGAGWQTEALRVSCSSQGLMGSQKRRKATFCPPEPQPGASTDSSSRGSRGVLNDPTHIFVLHAAHLNLRGARGMCVWRGGGTRRLSVILCLHG